jgi:predicted DNA-binding protein (MmcQ/YjbR family)
MDIEATRQYCLDLRGTSESFPFDETTLVFKVANKMFCLESLDNKSLNLKATPENVIDLIERYDSVSPAYHMNKKHWVTVNLETFDNDKLLQKLISDSYQLIVNKLTKKEKAILDGYL